MKRKYYDMLFAMVSIRLFLEKIAVHYQHQVALTESDQKKVDKIMHFLVYSDEFVSNDFLHNIADGQNLVILCQKCGNNHTKANYLMSNEHFNQVCFDALLKGFEQATSENFEANDMLCMESLLISCKYMPEERLRKFAKSQHIFTRASVAKNPACPIDLLEILAHDKSRRVRISVARNHSTPEYLLMELAGDQSVEVRRAVACNRSSSANVIRKLILIVDYETYRLCVYNPNCPADVLETLARYTNKVMDKTYYIRMNISTHKNANKAVYEAIRSDNNPILSQISFANTNCPIDELYNFNPKLKYAKSVAYHILERDDLTDEIVKHFFHNMGARIRAVVIHKRELSQEDLLMYYQSKSKDVISELVRKLKNNDALMYIMERYGNDTDSNISGYAASSLGSGSAKSFIEYLKKQPKNWKHDLRNYLAHSSCTEEEMWQVFDEFCDVRKNMPYPLDTELLGSISYREDICEKSIERFIEYACVMKKSMHTNYLVASFDNFYSKSLLNMCMSYIEKIEAEGK